MRKEKEKKVDKKQKLLDQIAQEIEECKICQQNKIGRAVPGEGNPDAEIMFIGEAPGKVESQTGRPFVGRSGQLLRNLIKEFGLKEEEIYITSPVKYLPSSGTPTPADIKHGKIHFDRQLDIIDPKFIVLLGSVATQAVLGEKLAILKMHGQIIEKNGKRYFISLHPAAPLRNPAVRSLFLEDFKKLKKLI
jgi:uracil-DNA glycosylase